MEEGKLFDKKSLRFLKEKKIDWSELAKDCISFANAHGGNILIGVEDDSDLPPDNQKIDDKAILETIHKRISEKSINVTVAVTLEVASNKAEYIRIHVFRNVNSLASTTDGKYYIRVADSCKPVMPEDIARIAADKNAFVWEEQTTMRIDKSKVDEKKKADFLRDVRTSKRVSAFIKEKTDEELLDYYGFQKDNYLTNLGVLWIGERRDRSSLRFSPIVQIIRYNEREEKVWKMMIDDFYLNPKEILDKIITEVSDWQESIEVPDGAYRKNVPFYPEEVIRELCTNALVHRTYTARGDIFINIYHDRLEIHNPGNLPYGVTPKNILSKSVRRNENLCKVFFDLNLMESEGSGYDMVFAKVQIYRHISPKFQINSLLLHMHKYGLIGFPLTHSFSRQFFTEKFAREQIDAHYLNFEMEAISNIREMVRDNPELKGLNVTIPHKESVIPFLDGISAEAEKIGAVNVVKIENDTLIGYNTDYIGFKNSISPLLRPDIHKRALILGTGGASKAVAHALTDLGLEWKYVSRTKNENNFTYNELTREILSEYTVIINASPVGTSPNINEWPPIFYEFITPNHLFYDLVYNPAETLFLKKGKERGATIKNGLEMLELQALAAWEIFNSKI